MKKTMMMFLLLSFAKLMFAQSIGTDADKYRQFDFWLGKWEVYKFGTNMHVGESHIQSVADSMALLENYNALGSAYKGKSLNKYNPKSGKWEQFWVDNSGLSLYLSGSFSNGSMILDDVGNEAGNKEYNRIVWKKTDNNTVRQTWSVSAEAGESWDVVFDGEYRRKKEK